MMLEMYIDNILIDTTQMDFSFCSTIRQMEEQVQDTRSYLYKINFDKAFIAHQTPTFYLTAASKANQIIEEDLVNCLVPDLEEELKLKRSNKIAE